jgi:hypothetical protein
MRWPCATFLDFWTPLAFNNDRMAFNLVDRLTYVMSYGLLALGLIAFVSGFFLVVFQLLSPWLFKKFAPTYKPLGNNRIRVSNLLVAVAGIAILILCYKLMFMRFRTLALKEDRIELGYFWPRSDVILEKASFESFRIEKDKKGSGELVIFAKDGRYKSTVFDKSVDTDAIQRKLTGWGKN